MKKGDTKNTLIRLHKDTLQLLGQIAQEKGLYRWQVLNLIFSKLSEQEIRNILAKKIEDISKLEKVNTENTEKICIRLQSENYDKLDHISKYTCMSKSNICQIISENVEELEIF